MRRHGAHVCSDTFFKLHKSCLWQIYPVIVKKINKTIIIYIFVDAGLPYCTVMWIPPDRGAAHAAPATLYHVCLFLLDSSPILAIYIWNLFTHVQSQYTTEGVSLSNSQSNSMAFTSLLPHRLVLLRRTSTHITTITILNSTNYYNWNQQIHSGN